MTKQTKNLCLYVAVMFVCFGILVDGQFMSAKAAPKEDAKEVIADYPFYEDLGDICDLKVNNSMTVEQEIRTLAKCHGINEDKAVAIAKCESGLNPAAMNQNHDGTNDKGVYQINSIHNVPDSCRLDKTCNISWAMNKMVNQGFRPWKASQTCWK